MDKYKPRIIDKLLERRLQGIGAVLIEGPKWCGKTTTAKEHAKTTLYMDDPSQIEQNLTLSEVNPKELLLGETPRLIDEWQLAPKLWDAARFEIDQRSRPGQFIFTGSSTPINTDKIHHSGLGRFAWLTMRPMSLYESEDSSGEVSLEELFSFPKTISGRNSLSLEDIAFLICRGGWPASTNVDKILALDQAKNYYEGIVRSDLPRVDNSLRNKDTIKHLLRSYARHQATQASIATIAKDMNLYAAETPCEKTISSYIEALKKIFVIEDSRAWNPNLRSKSAIRSSPTRYFIDPSIAAISLGLGPKDLIHDLKTMGLLFETMCIRDLRVFADSLDGEIYHFRDKLGLECDAVIHLRNGKYGLIEIKLGGDTAITNAAQTLLKVAQRIDTDKMKAPEFLMVLTALGGYAYRRKDGIYVVPIGCLKD